MLDGSFLPPPFMKVAPATWAPTDHFPAATREAWSSNAISGDFNPLDNAPTKPNEPSKAKRPLDDVQIILKRMFLQNDLVAQLEGFSDLPSDWAGDETVLPSRGTISSAKTLLSSLSSDHILPQVSPSADGEIGFTWLMNGLRVEALLYPDNHLVWLWSSDGTVNPGGEQLFNGSFPDGLLDKIADATT